MIIGGFFIMLKYVTATICALTLLLLTAGCTEEQAPEPPVSRAELTHRLFEALDSRRDNDALAIVDKLLALDNNDSDLMEMRERILGNICTRQVQAMIDKGDLDKAAKYIRNQRLRYPGLPKLQFLENEVDALIVLRTAARELAAADSVADLTIALSKITPLAAKYPEARLLQRDIRRRQQDLQKMRNAASSASGGSRQ